MNRGPSPFRLLLVVGLTIAAGVKFLGWLDLNGRSRTLPTLTGTATVAGVVVDEQGAPIPDANVSGRVASEDGRYTQVTRTDQSGRFKLAEVPAGTLTLRFQSPGHAGRNRAPNQAGSRPLWVEDDEPVTGVVLTLVRGAAISGRAFRPDGAPAGDMYVRAMRRHQDLHGRWVFNSTPITGTGPGGAFAIEGLTPGEYSIMAALDRTTLEQVYYPGVWDLADAESVTLGPAETRTGLDIRPDRTEMGVVAGRIAERSGKPWYGAIELRRGRADEPNPIVRRGLPDADGRFEFVDIPRGDYWLVARTATQSEEGTGTASWATQYVSTPGGSADVRFVMPDGFTISGRAIVEKAGAEAVSLSRALRLVGADPSTIASASAPRPDVGPNGEISFTGLPAGQYRVVATPPRGLWLKSLESSAGTMPEILMSVGTDHPDTSFTVTFTDRPNALRGRATDANGEPAAHHQVVVFSEDRRHWPAGSGRFRTSLTQADGTFEVLGLLPGDYFVAAMVPGRMAGPADWKTLTALSVDATRVSVSEDGVHGALVVVSGSADR